MSTNSIKIGIDPGTNTGYAVWSPKSQSFSMVGCAGIISVFEIVLELNRWSEPGTVEVWFEDARFIGGGGKGGTGRLQGAGSIKRDCSVWEEFLDYHNIAYRKIKPQRGSTKWDDKRFKRTTGWAKRTNEHSRDAGVIVFGSK